MAAALSLQDLELEHQPDTRADLYRSVTSIYACVVTSAHSIAC